MYIDTSLVAAAVLFGTEHHTIARDFGADLATSGSIEYFSQLLRVELLQALRKIGSDPNGLRESVRR